MTKLTSLITADGKVVDVYAEDDTTSEEEFDDVFCFWCEKDINEYEDDAFYHSTTNAWYCEDCYTFMLENE